MSANGLTPPPVRACLVPVPVLRSARPPVVCSVRGSSRRCSACGSPLCPDDPKYTFIGPCAGLAKLPHKPVQTR
eukprot:3644336-Alexandrium_andersonii.AAC.1